MESSDVLKKRLLYQSQHRGLKEMDLALGGFAGSHIQEMQDSELKKFEALLAFSDQEIYGWIFENKPIPQEAPQALIQVILQNLKP